MDGGVAGLPGQSALLLVEITASPAPEHAQGGGQGQTARERVTVDGDWGEWTPWEVCSITKCGGQQTRTRSCDNPAPAHGGCYCTGNGHDTQGVTCFCAFYNAS